MTALALELVPRITRAQSMDVLSSQSTVAGYKAVLIAADTLPRLLPMMTTAAGTLPPAKAFVLGAGVAGLQAIATARRLGAVVSAFDVRAAAREQVASLGAAFVAAETVSAVESGRRNASTIPNATTDLPMTMMATTIKTRRGSCTRIIGSKSIPTATKNKTPKASCKGCKSAAARW